MNGYRVSLVRFGFGALLLGASFAGCRGEGVATDQATRGAEVGAECTDFQGHLHCPLGGARLENRGDELRATELKSAEDGVAILLPEVTEFISDGRFEGQGSVMFARSINEGVSTSTMTLQRSDAGYLVSASFTGNGDESKYDLNLYRRGELVGRIRDLGPDVNTPVERYNCIPGPWPNCRPPTPPHFRVVQRRTTPGDRVHAAPLGDPSGEPGACVWTQPIDEVLVTLEDGQQVIADRLELVEIVPAAGSYAYFTFNRIDYTSDGGGLVLTKEQVK
jgi:hypothetical protein